MKLFTTPDEDAASDYLNELNDQCERRGWGQDSGLWVVCHVANQLMGHRLGKRLSEPTGPPTADMVRLQVMIRGLPVLLREAVAPPPWLLALGAPEWAGFAIRYEDAARTQRVVWLIDPHGRLSCLRRDRFKKEPQVFTSLQARDTPGVVAQDLLGLVTTARRVRADAGMGV